MSEPGDGDHFDRLYRSARRDPARLGWTREGADPMLVAWAERSSSPPGRAAVVACGLGDDAEVLGARGWEVTAFDISPTAIEWCRERFPGSPVDYLVADLLDLPPAWHAGFDLVVEVWTIQSLPPHRWAAAIEAIAALVAPGGTLLVSALTSNEALPRPGPPWPVRREVLDGFLAADLVETTRAEHPTPFGSIGLLEIEYRALRPRQARPPSS